nr:MAG TPA: hypothetical protein [Caudoviricetes sp.]
MEGLCDGSHAQRNNRSGRKDGHSPRTSHRELLSHRGEREPRRFYRGGNRLKSLVIQASDDTHLAGTTAEAGLPNITGVFSRKVNNSYGFKGAFYEMELGEKTSGEYGGTGYPSGVGFDASRSNAIYGKSDTVQPPARFCNVWKRIS